MAEKRGPSVETFTFRAGSYDRLKTNEEELFELVKLSAVPIDKQLFKVILELLKFNVAPTAILQVLKSLRPQSTPEDISSQSPVIPRAATSPSLLAYSKQSSSSLESSSLPFPPTSHVSKSTENSDQSEPLKEGKVQSRQSFGRAQERKHKSRSSTKGQSKDMGVVKAKSKDQLEPS